MMKLQLCLFAIKSIQEVRKYALHYKSSLSSNPKAIAYNSELIANVQLSIEILYEYLGWNNRLKCFPVILLEAIKAGFKFRELMSMYRIGYHFYIDKTVFYDKVLMITEDEHLSNFSFKDKYISSFY